MKTLLWLILLFVLLPAYFNVSLLNQETLRQLGQACLTMFSSDSTGDGTQDGTDGELAGDKKNETKIRLALPKTPTNQEKKFAQQVRRELKSLREDGYLEDARLRLADIRPLRKSSMNTITQENEYEAVLVYDLLSPLSKSAGSVALTTVCSLGLAQVRLTDESGYGKTFSCPSVD